MRMAYDVELDPQYQEKLKARLKSTERTLVLRPKAGKKPKSSIGLIDPRLFSGEEDNLKAIKDPQNNLWTFKYSYGILPQPLKQSFTTFNALHAFGQHYFGKRDLEIVKVID